TENADEPHAPLLAKAIALAQCREPITTTTALAAIIRETLDAVPRSEPDDSSALDTFLRNLPSCLRPGGRVAILTFHSGEDRRVKQAFKAGERDGVYSEIARDVLRPSAEEVRTNPRSSSAKLRWARRA